MNANAAGSVDNEDCGTMESRPLSSTVMSMHVYPDMFFSKKGEHTCPKQTSVMPIHLLIWSVRLKLIVDRPLQEDARPCPSLYEC